MRVVLLFILMSISLFSTARNYPNTPEILVTELRPISQISVGHDGSWFVETAEGWGLEGCPSATTLHIESTNRRKDDYIQLLSTINDYSKVLVSANARCSSGRMFMAIAENFITVKNL